MKPFNLEKALAGEKVITRDGREVLHVCAVPREFWISVEYPIIAVIKTHGECTTESFTIFGFHNSGAQSNNDLFMAPCKKEYWANLYRTKEGEIEIGGTILYTSEREAKSGAIDCGAYLGAVLIHTEEV